MQQLISFLPPYECLASVFLHEPKAAQSEKLTNNRTAVNVATVAVQSDGVGSKVNGATIEIENPVNTHRFRHRRTGKQTSNKPAKLIDFAAHLGASTTSILAVNTSLISLEACSHSLPAPSKLLHRPAGSSKKSMALIPLLNGCRIKSKIGWEFLQNLWYLLSSSLLPKRLLQTRRAFATSERGEGARSASRRWTKSFDCQPINQRAYLPSETYNNAFARLLQWHFFFHKWGKLFSQTFITFD